MYALYAKQFSIKWKERKFHPKQLIEMHFHPYNHNLLMASVYYINLLKLIFIGAIGQKYFSMSKMKRLSDIRPKYMNTWTTTPLLFPKEINLAFAKHYKWKELHNMLTMGKSK